MIDWKRIEKEFPRRFVADGMHPDRWQAIEPYFQDLVDRPLRTAGQLEAWLLDQSDLEACLEEERTRRYVAMTRQTDDPERERDYLAFIETIQPKCKIWWQKLRERFVECAPRAELPRPRYTVLDRNIQAQVEIFREENVPLQTEDQKLRQRYQKICGAQTATFEGREQTLQQIARHLEEQDRTVRRSAWLTTENRRLQDREEMDEIFDEMVGLRHRIGTNAGFACYRDYMFRALGRFDYTPADCEEFHAAIEAVAVPAARELAERRRKRLGLDALRPWDLHVDPRNQPPLHPFKTAGQLTEGCRKIFAEIDPELSGQFRTMLDLGLLDLESRKGKAPGGYMSEFQEYRLPFIFMNAVGRHTDVQTLLHEAGHAFHTFACRPEPFVQYRSAPMEFSEVASMGMEMLSQPWLDTFYSEAEKRRACREHLEDVIRLLPWIATIDAYQHWIYTHPEHSREERTQAWLALHRRFGGIEDYAGFEESLEARWQRQLHLYEVPFYYIEYGIAQLGALQLWLNDLNDPKKTVAEYRTGLALGGSRPLPELFAATGIRFDFSAETVRPLVDKVMEEIRALDG